MALGGGVRRSLSDLVVAYTSALLVLGTNVRNVQGSIAYRRQRHDQLGNVCKAGDVRRCAILEKSSGLLVGYDGQNVFSLPQGASVCVLRDSAGLRDEPEVYARLSRPDAALVIADQLLGGWIEFRIPSQDRNLCCSEYLARRDSGTYIKRHSPDRVGGEYP